MSSTLPEWAQKLKELFLSGSMSQFVLYGNIFDVFPQSSAASGSSYHSLKGFLEEVMLQNYDTIIYYDRGKGIRVTKGDKEWSKWIRSAEYAEMTTGNNFLDPEKALRLIDTYILRTLNLQAVSAQQGKPIQQKLAIVIDFAQFIVPRGEPIYMSGEIASQIVKILGWASDPAILKSNIASFLITEKLNDVNPLIVENPRCAKIELSLPSETEMTEYLQSLGQSEFSNLQDTCDVSLEVLAKRMTGMSRISARNIIARTLSNGERITVEQLRRMKKETIERECQDLLEFIESPFTLEMVSGLTAVKRWLRDDAALIQAGKLHALPMGYLISGRIGTGKTFLVQCWAGELGIPCVVLKNFRDKWVGATESNLEKIFSILRALGQVVVFVDEADQMTGKRDGGQGDQGLSGRVYAMLAKEMSLTANRGKIIWVFATSRPDLLEVDLKRQGRLDVHIPLFPPQSSEEYRQLFLTVAKKLKYSLTPEDIPDIPKGAEYGGNEIEGLLIRALRILELSPEQKPIKQILVDLLGQMKPNAYGKKLEYMDLIAVQECTDSVFLPERFARLNPDQIDQKIDEIKRYV
jgi:hypothetical protein